MSPHDWVQLGLFVVLAHLIGHQLNRHADARNTAAVRAYLLAMLLLASLGWRTLDERHRRRRLAAELTELTELVTTTGRRVRALQQWCAPLADTATPTPTPRTAP